MIGPETPAHERTNTKNLHNYNQPWQGTLNDDEDFSKMIMTDHTDVASTVGDTTSSYQNNLEMIKKLKIDNTCLKAELERARQDAEFWKRKFLNICADMY